MMMMIMMMIIMQYFVVYIYTAVNIQNYIYISISCKNRSKGRADLESTLPPSGNERVH